jgi:lipoprotein-anchoring transpeptidase ErfK/SrfK
MRRPLLLAPIPVLLALAGLGMARRAPDPGPAAVAVAAPAPTTTEAPTTTAPTPPPPPAAPKADPPRFPTTVAVARVPNIAVYDQPAGLRGPNAEAGKVMATLPTPAPYSHMPQVFTVRDTAGAPPGWLPVDLRIRPNGSTGWIRAEDVTLDNHSWSIDINLAERWATVYDGAEVFTATPVVIGTDATPTPVGDYFVTEAVWTSNPAGAYGPYIFGLSAHTDVYTEFNGGDGQVGLHGTNQPALVGTAASNGCVRFPNAEILRMARALPMGVPVHIHG